MTSELEQRLDDFQRVINERDRVAAETVLHPDYALVLVHPAPAVITRSQWLDALPAYIVDEWAVQERHIDVDGGCAAVLQRGFQRATVRGQDRSGVFIVSDVWLRTGNTWQIWKRHSTPLTAGTMPAG